MKNILSSLNESEKRRILEMHHRASKRQYLMEDPTTPTLKNKDQIDEPGFPVNSFQGAKGVYVTFDPAAGTGKYSGNQAGVPGTTYRLSYTVKCKCPNFDDPSVAVHSYYDSENVSKEQRDKAIMQKGNINKWYNERCQLYNEGKCETVKATRAALNAVYQNVANGELQPGDRKTICTFVRAKQGNIGMEGHTDKIKIMDQVLSNTKFYSAGNFDQKELSQWTSTDFTEKGEIFCKSWGL